jgi:hypothetical protein
MVTPIPRLAMMWPWAGELPYLMVRGLGVIDLAGGLESFCRWRPGSNLG